MRGHTAMRGQDVRYTLEVDLLEAINGAKKRVTMPDGGVLDLTVPEGVDDGQVLRMKGKGQPGMRGGEPGDALVEIKLRPHPQFKRDGIDLLVSLPISLDEAVLGGKVEVPTAGGRVQLSIPKGTSSGQVFRLKGKGVLVGIAFRVVAQIISDHQFAEGAGDAHVEEAQPLSGQINPYLFGCFADFVIIK